MSDDRFSREEIARIYGVTEEELADDSGWSEARAAAAQERDSFVDRLRVVWEIDPVAEFDDRSGI